MKQLAWAVVTLGLLIVAPAALQAQDSTTVPTPQVQLPGNYPNPFNPETTIPFVLDRVLWATGDQPVVSLRIYNILAQLVAIPILQGSGEPLENVSLAWNGTGEYAAYWDGRVLGSDREAPSGVYVYQLTINGRTYTKKMTVVK